MKLRVNLIAEKEVRDCSVVTPRFLIRLTGALVATAVLAVFGWVFIVSQQRATALKAEEWKWGRLESDFKQAQALSKRLRAAEFIVADLDVWRTVRHKWSDDLTAIAVAFPETLQLTDLSMTRATVIPAVVIPKSKPGAKPPRSPPPSPPEFRTSLRLTGVTSSPTAEDDVAGCRKIFTEHPFTNTVTAAVIPPGAFRQNPAVNAGPNDRIFEIICTYRVITL